MVQLEHDTEADAVYVRLSDHRVTRTEDIGAGRLVDYDAAGQPVGVEFLGVSRGVDTDGVPDRLMVERSLSEHDIPLYA